MDWQPPVLETERLLLRPITSADATAVFLYASNPNVAKYTLWDAHQTIEDSHLFVDSYRLSRYANREPDPLGIILKSDPIAMVIGSVGAYWVSKPHGVMEMGYTISEPFWGRGIAKEASTALIEYVFHNYPVHRLQARTLDGNVQSERVLQKLGFAFEGLSRSAIVHSNYRWDVKLWSFLRSDLNLHSEVESSIVESNAS